jgi:hypothetical protein
MLIPPGEDTRAGACDAGAARAPNRAGPRRTEALNDWE